MTKLGIVVAIAVCLFAAPISAQGTRADLDVATAELQKKPGDAALRERAIKIALALVPTPDPPEEARRAFVRGNTALEAAKTPADYDRAIALYEQALRLAPWFADAYFNQSKAYELRQRFPDAIAALRWYKLAAPNAGDTRAAQDKIYVLEEKAEAIKRARPPAAKPATPAQTRPAVPVRPAVTIEGVWRIEWIQNNAMWWETITIRKSGSQYSLAIVQISGARPFSIVSASDTSMKIRADWLTPPNYNYTNICDLQLSNGGESLERTCQMFLNGAVCTNPSCQSRDTLRRTQ
ncbi:MAG: hypothetical protein AB7G15_11265 [Alphaproteobacteria bacterium]